LVLLFLSFPLALAKNGPLSDFNLQRRPLNTYVTANAVHVKTANRSITIDKTTISYSEAFPPFLIRNRGSVLLLTDEPHLLFAGRPSLFQMVTASGHRTIVPYVVPRNLAALLKQAEVHHTIIVCFPSTKSEMPFSQLEGVVLINPAEDSDLPPPSLPTVLLYTDGKTADQGQGDDWARTRVESITFPVTSLADSPSVKGREKFGQILTNFFDRIHLR
ncbi:hypothetical protein PMAYCL1PPCAC_14689, partial [Pristionchus mayeri]